MQKFSIIVILVLITISCKKTETQIPVIENPLGTLELVESFNLDVTEPSGLSFGQGKNTLLTVSDNTNTVFELDLQGQVLRELDYVGKDLEGVTYNPDENQIIIAEEADRELTILDYTSGQFIATYKINIAVGSDNSGLEGVSYNQNNKLYYVLNETNPDLMLLWNPISGIISEEKLDIAADYSGIFVDVNKSHIWIVSDQSERLFKCDYSMKVIKEYKLAGRKYEGVVIDNNLAYLINDATAKMEIYKIID